MPTLKPRRNPRRTIMVGTVLVAGSPGWVSRLEVFFVRGPERAWTLSRSGRE